MLTEVAATRGAAKALEVEHFRLGSHHEIVLGEDGLAGRTAGAVQSEKQKQYIFR